MKNWFALRNKCFVLGLSLDGTKETHDTNRSNSFDLIDFDFFLKNYPEQGVKMTLSDFSLNNLAENIKFVHSLGFKKINGVNLAEGDFDFSSDKYIEILAPQLKELVDFYVENDNLEINQMLGKQLHLCERQNHERKKWCGIGTGCVFFDTDGKRYPCSYITPMTFSGAELSDIVNTDYNDDENFIDDECYSGCYIYPVCPICYGANYSNCKTFKQRDKGRCNIQKLISLFVADLHAKRIVKNPKQYDENILYSTIEAIKKIRELYLVDFERFLS